MADANQPISAAMQLLEDYEDEIDRDARRWIQRADYIPENIGYDWLPFCRALIENHRDAKGVFQPPSPDPPSPIRPPPRDPRRRVREKDVRKGLQDPEAPLGNVPTLDESWKHVSYIPAWMDPDYSEQFITTTSLHVRQNTTRDAVYNLRPAMRLTDGIRNPTEYALRFGMAEGRLDGRSRMSPSWSKTRNPMDDFANQVNMLSDTDRRLAEELSAAKYKELGVEPPIGQPIHPDVMDGLLQKHGLITNEELLGKLEQGAKEGSSLDQMIYEFEQQNPDNIKAHQVFFENAKDDQDYQRIRCTGITTDELIQTGSFSMSNDVVMDLDNPIHPLLARNRWEYTYWKGVNKKWPRYVYNINGTRETWSFYENDALWDAVQPALRLVSLVLSKKPPLLEALMNMNTRQPIPASEDDRPEVEKKGSELVKYVLEEDIDMSKTFPMIRELTEKFDYDWKANVWRVLDEALVLELDSCYGLVHNLPHRDDVADDPGAAEFNYGSTGAYRRTGHHNKRWIKIKLGIDLLWPLLAPQYSQSEKMVCTYVVATTLLHEFAHAVCQATAFLTREEYGKVEGQDPEIMELLQSMKGVLFDPADWNDNEPFFQGLPTAEVGEDFEDSLWGRTSNLQSTSSGLPRYMENIVILTGRDVHPETYGDDRKAGLFPMLLHSIPVSLPYIAKFFRKSFWEEEFEAYGFSALKMAPDNLVQKTLAWRYRVDNPLSVAVFGKSLSSFLKAVPEILGSSRQHVLGQYLESLKLELLYQAQYDLWWKKEIENWKQEEIYPLEGKVELLEKELEKVSLLRAERERTDKASQTHFYSQYYDSVDASAGNVMGLGEWQQDVARRYHEMFRYGGTLMQRLLVVHNQMQDELGKLQRLCFYLLSVKPPSTLYHVKPKDGKKDTAVSQLYERAERFHNVALQVSKQLGRISESSVLEDIGDKWNQWQDRFETDAIQYGQLMQWLLDGEKPTFSPLDIPAKARFHRLPTAQWKPVSERYKKMAAREYNRAPWAVRRVVDEYLSQFTRLKAEMNSQSGINIEQIVRALASMEDIDRRTGPRVSSMFGFSVPSTQPQIGSLVAPAAAATPTATATAVATAATDAVTAAAAPPSTAVFGVPSGLGMAHMSLGGNLPRRLFRVEKPTSYAQQQSAGYRSYVTNLLTSPDPLMASKAATTLFTSGVPQPILDLLPEQRQLAQGSGAIPFVPFPNPYASHNLMTSEAIAFEEQKELQRKSRQATQQAAGRYRTSRLWRDREPSENSDDSS